MIEKPKPKQKSKTKWGKVEERKENAHTVFFLYFLSEEMGLPEF